MIIVKCHRNLIRFIASMTSTLQNCEQITKVGKVDMKKLLGDIAFTDSC